MHMSQYSQLYVVMSAWLLLGSVQALACANPQAALGVARIVEVDAQSGPLFGRITKQVREDDFLRAKEVVLTFDDGPVPWITGPILETLKRHCTKATFFSVGKMAAGYGKTVRDILDAGHTLAGHTWSHPLNLPKMARNKAIAEIERGFSAVLGPAGGEVAPFFRFPGLNDSAPLLDYLQKRGIAAFTVDVVSDDSFINDPERLARVTLERIEARRGGIVLFHDIKPATARALPVILDQLKRRGYSVVHLRSRAYVAPHPDFPVQGEAANAVALKGTRFDGDGNTEDRKLLPFFGAVILKRALDPDIVGRPVARVSPPRRERTNGERAGQGGAGARPNRPGFGSAERKAVSPPRANPRRNGEPAREVLPWAPAAAPNERPERRPIPLR